MKITQIAIAVPDNNEACENLADLLDVQLVQDQLLMDGMMLKRLEGEMIEINGNNLPLTLAFCFNLIEGCELEYITADSVLHWHKDRVTFKPFLSHLGMYCDNKEFEIFEELMHKNNITILQNTYSHDHTNLREDGSERKYHDIIFDTEELIGFNLKITRKI